MDLLVSPLEATLPFRYSATVAGSAWAWLAVLAAAFSLWRIRAVGSKSDSPPEPPACAAPAQSQVMMTSAPPALSGSAPALRSPPCHMEGDGTGTPKGRFTAYFHVEDNGDERDEVEGEGDGVSDVDSEEEWTLGRRVDVKMRGDLGWYRYQDLTALNGSVVRLWDGDGGLTAASPSGGT